MKTMAIEFTLTRDGVLREFLSRDEAIKLTDECESRGFEIAMGPESVRCRILATPKCVQAYWRSRNELDEDVWAGGAYDLGECPPIIAGVRIDAHVILALAIRRMGEMMFSISRELPNGSTMFDLGTL